MTNSGRIKFVLCRTQMAENIGAAARAMKTMGMSQLVLVAPQAACDAKAQAMATHGEDVLANAKVVNTLEQAVADCHRVWATTARSRSLTLPEIDARQAAMTIAQDSGRGQAQTAIVFGAERTGLTNAELTQAGGLIRIHADAAFGVLNLAQAVQLLAYELHYALTDPPEPNLAPGASRQALYGMLQRLEALAVDSGFFDTNEDAERQAARRTRLMQRITLLFQRGRVQEDELQILHGIISALEKQIQKKS